LGKLKGKKVIIGLNFFNPPKKEGGKKGAPHLFRGILGRANLSKFPPGKFGGPDLPFIWAVVVGINFRFH